MPGRLVDRHSVVAPAELITGLRPPPLFAQARFDTYRPDPHEPSQAAALAATRAFADGLHRPVRLGRLGRRSRPTRRGLYLDGGYGVGKTHLLAALWHAAPDPKAYVTFVELTHLVGAVGFAGAVERLGGMALLAVDEFELDDPGDTVLVSSLLARLVERGVAPTATSNTLPDRLGDERFATEDFLREIQGLAAHFDTVRIDGPDFRHRGAPMPPPPRTPDEVITAAGASGATCDDFTVLLRHLAGLHPSAYGALVDGVALVGLTGLEPLVDEAAALRLVVLVDRLYDRQVPLVTAGVAVNEVFGPGMLAGGYRKKYRRAISRMVALEREGVPGGQG